LGGARTTTNPESFRGCSTKRLKRIQKAVGKGDFANLKICSLRGKASLFCKNFENIKTRITEEGAKVVIIDPVYKFLLGKEESSNGVVADVLERLTVFCMEAQVAMIYVHHHSKGNQASKESMDRSSGAGASSRDPDAILDLVEHKDSTQEARISTAEITVRDFPPIESFVVRWNFPLLEKDTEGLDPSELKQPKQGGRPKDDNTDRILAVFRFVAKYSFCRRSN
jgi:RecA-family ATPase